MDAISTLLVYPTDYVLHWEDEKLEGKVTTDRGGKTRFGLSQHANPDLTDENYYNKPRSEALSIARRIYAFRYGLRVLADHIVDERVRAKVLDMYVNMGTHGITLTQRAVGAHEDGAIGPESLLLINGATPDRLLNRLAEFSLSHYERIDGTPNEHESWARRARCLGKIGVNMTLLRGAKTNEQVPVLEQHG